MRSPVQIRTRPGKDEGLLFLFSLVVLVLVPLVVRASQRNVIATVFFGLGLICVNEGEKEEEEVVKGT